MRRIALLVKWVVDYALPPRCPGCGAVTPDDYQFCSTCWQSIDFIGAPACRTCGVPVAADGLICGPCLADPPRHDGVRAVMAYGDVARYVVLRLKYNRRIGNARTMAVLMAHRISQHDDVVLIPVPLHRWRIWQRGYNQSALIAGHLARLTHAPMIVDGLMRVRATRSLAGLGRKARAKEVRAAFRINPKQSAGIRGRHVLLVDDVYTSGATANACARTLKAAGAARVEVLCWARAIAAND
jgi:ComF family protein